jgi:hypothetical protein
LLIVLRLETGGTLGVEPPDINISIYHFDPFDKKACLIVIEK